jgi:hypothetical protein
MAAVDVAGADLRVDQPAAGEHARRVAPEPDEQHADDAVAAHVLEQRAGIEALALAGRRQRRERRLALEPRGAVEVTRPGASSVRVTGPFSSAQRSSQRPSRSGGTS